MREPKEDQKDNTPLYDICADECIKWLKSECTEEERRPGNITQLIAAFTAGFYTGYDVKRQGPYRI